MEVWECICTKASTASTFTNKLSNLSIISLFRESKNHATFSPGINRCLVASEVKFVGVKMH